MSTDSKGLSKLRIVGWVLSGLLAGFLIFASALGKFSDWEGKAEMLDRTGWSSEVMFKIGIVEVAIAILFLIPRVAFIGAILLTAYLGGATASHVRLSEPFLAPVLVGVAAWTALGLRDPRVFALAFHSRRS